ncbi:MAG: L-ectoine synthase [Betaproteobacteria bacterium]|nr:L-ectoine synthase [Betaproteobacteria bacterium]
MIVRQIDELAGSPQEVVTPNWTSRRLLLKRDGMGFSMHETVIQAGTQTYIWYKHHLEAVLCIEGEGEVEVLPEGRIYPIAPGTLYALDQHDRHYLRARTCLRLVCVFNPPLTGREVHDEEGVYPLVEEQAAG